MMKKRNLMVVLLCSLVVLMSAVPINAKETAVNKEETNESIMTRGVFSVYEWFGCQNGAGAFVQILKNDTGNRISILGVALDKINGDIGVPQDSISLTSTIYDNGAYAIIVLHYTYFGTSKSKAYTIYAY